MPAVENRAPINRQGTPHPDHGDGRSVALQKERHTRFFDTPSVFGCIFQNFTMLHFLLLNWQNSAPDLALPGTNALSTSL